MTIKSSTWERYRNKLSALGNKATAEFADWIARHGGLEAVDTDAMIEYAYALATKYGAGSSTLAAMMYDSVATVSGTAIPDAVVANTATYGEVAKNIHGVLKVSKNEGLVAGVVGRLVKQAAADTTLKNAKRDGAEYAWIPSGDTCAFCELLASNGWQKASKAVLEGGHADHIHANCDCQFMIRFNSDTNVEGYNPQKYTDELVDTGERTWNDRVNALRRENYSENKNEINQQKRIAYAKRVEAEESEQES